MYQFINNLRNPITSILIIRAITAAAAFSVTPFIVLLLTTTYGYSALSASTILTISTITAALSAPIIGSYAKNKTYFFLLLLGSLLGGMSLLMLGILSKYFFYASLAAIILGGSTAILSVSFRSSLPYFLDSENLPFGYSLLHMASNFGSAIGPIIITFAIAKQQFSLAFIINSCLFFLSGILVFSIPKKWGNNSVTKKENHIIKENDVPTNSLVSIMTYLMLVIIEAASIQMIFVGFAVYMNAFFNRPDLTTIFFTCESILALIIVPLGGRFMNHWSMNKLFFSYVIGICLTCIGFMFFGLFPKSMVLLGLVVLAITILTSEMLSVPPSGSLVSFFVSTKKVGTLFGLADMFQAAGRALGAIGGGALLVIFKEHLPLFWIISGITLLALTLLCGMLIFLEFIKNKHNVKEAKEL